MTKLRRLLIYITVLIASILVVHASGNSCFMEGCVNPGSSTSEASNSFWTLHSVRQNNLVTSPNIVMCSIDGSSYPLVGGNLLGDELPAIAEFVPGYLKIYRQDCTLLIDHTLNASTTAAPQVTNFDEDQYQEITYISESSIQGLEYDGVDSFDSSFWINYTLSTSQGGFDMLSCARRKVILTNGQESSYCLMFKYGSRDMLVYYPYNNSVTYRPNFLPLALHNIVRTNGMATQFTSSNAQGFTLICGINDGGGTSTNCYNIVNDGELIYHTLGNQIAVSGAITGYPYIMATYADLSGVKVILMNIAANKGASATYALNQILYHPGTSSKLNVTGTSSTKFIIETTMQNSSNWMVGDYTKSGQNFACIMIRDHDDKLLKCYDGSGNVRHTSNFTSQPINITRTMAMGDFNRSEDTLGLVSADGIFYPTYAHYRTNLSYETNRTGMIISNPTSGSPIYAFVDSSQGFIITDSTILAACGDGTCSVYESCYTCLSDCNCTLDTGECYSDTDCTDEPFTSCLGYQCVSGLTDIACTSNSDCPVNASLCYYNRCIRSVYGGVEPTDPGLDNEHLGSDGTCANIKPRGSYDFGYFIRMMFCAEPTLVLMFGIIAMITVAALVNNTINIYGSPIVTAVTYGGVFTFFVVSFIVSSWVLVLVALVSIALLFGYLFFGRQSAGG